MSAPVVAIAASSGRPDWRRFTDLDWYGFEGAERYPDGSAPWMAEIHVDGHEAVAVADASGCGVYSTAGDDVDDDWRCWTATGAVALNALLAMPRDTTAAALVAMGFVDEAAQ